MMNNMELYERFRTVPDSAKKAFNNGRFSGTDINPMWRIKALTEAFGACGEGWYYEAPETWREEYADGSVMAHCRVAIRYKLKSGEWSAPVYGIGGNLLVSVGKQGQRVSDEGYKMALTDALSVACKALGIGADVYFERDKSSKYAQYYTPEQPPREYGTPAPVEGITVEQIVHIKKLATPEQLEGFEKKMRAPLAEWSAEKAESCLSYLRKLNGYTV